MLTISIRTDHDAFAGNPRPEVARLLRQLADDIANDRRPGRSLRDTNGNPCGTVTATGKDRDLV